MHGVFASRKESGSAEITLISVFLHSREVAGVSG